LDCGTVCRVEEVEEEVHVDLTGEEGAGGGVDEEGAVEEVEGGDEEEVVCSGGGFREEAFEGRY